MATNVHGPESGEGSGAHRGSAGARFRAVVVALVVLLLPLAACGQSTPSADRVRDGGDASSSATASTDWDLVLLGDSVLLAGFTLEGRLERELGVTLQISNWLNPDVAKYAKGGERSADLVERLRTDEELRQDLRAAEVVVFDVPLGVIYDVCPGTPSTATSEDLARCLDEVVTMYEADVEAVFEELVALRDPADAMIRVTDVWQFFYPTFTAAGTYDVVRPRWQEMNQAVHDAADRYGIPVVAAYAGFTGPDGDRDPVASGDVEIDQIHLSNQGVERFVDLVISEGFAPLA